MVFTVISIAPNLTTGQFERAVAAGPPFVEAETDYRSMLAQSKWRLVACDDVTAAFADTMERQIQADRNNRDALTEFLGAGPYDERVIEWRSKFDTITDGLLRRELFVVEPV